MAELYHGITYTSVLFNPFLSRKMNVNWYSSVSKLTGSQRIILPLFHLLDVLHIRENDNKRKKVLFVSHIMSKVYEISLFNPAQESHIHRFWRKNEIVNYILPVCYRDRNRRGMS